MSAISGHVVLAPSYLNPMQSRKFKPNESNALSIALKMVSPVAELMDMMANKLSVTLSFLPNYDGLRHLVSSTINEKDFPRISSLSDSLRAGPRTSVINLVHFIRCNFTEAKQLSFPYLVIISPRWSIVLRV